MVIQLSYGPNVPHDGELRLCGDVAGKRAIELGVAPEVNCVALASAGAKAIAVDPDPARIAEARARAEAAEVRVECHTGELADLGFATSASIDLVIAAGTLHLIDDLSRVLRQVHRVLRPEAPFVVTLPHPFTAGLEGATVTTRYGTFPNRSVSDLFTAFSRANFRVDVVQELFAANAPDALVPELLLLRARKLGV
ncbi:MAG: methyltransferase domain-containing protein [Ilumatobacteraceae bacterium]